MRKLLLTLALLLTSILSFNYTKAENNLEAYQTILNEINEEYNTSFRIISESEYDSYEQEFGYDYHTYINTILNASLEEFRDSCVNSIVTEDTIYINLSPSNTRSVYETQAVLFNNAANRLKMTYYYIKTDGVKYFDRSYTPTATVTKVKNVDYFTMKSYTVLFLNNNTEMKVDLSGTITATYGILNNQSFTIYFDLV